MEKFFEKDLFFNKLICYWTLKITPRKKINE
jgi:hypothetical protein